MTNEEATKLARVCNDAQADPPLARRIIRLGRARLRLEAIESPVHAAEVGFNLLAGRDVECIAVLACDADRRLLTAEVLFTGGRTTCALHLPTLARWAVLADAHAVWIAHNHPTGRAVPSPADSTATVGARAALAAVEVELAGHVIVTDDPTHWCSA